MIVNAGIVVGLLISHGLGMGDSAIYIDMAKCTGAMVADTQHC